MEMIYNSDAFCVVRFEVPAEGLAGESDDKRNALARGGFEIVDKWSQKEIYIDGAMAAHFQHSVQALIDSSPSFEEIDDYLEQFSSIMQQPVALH